MYLSCAQDEAVFSAGEKKAKWIFVKCAVPQSEFYLSKYLKYLSNIYVFVRCGASQEEEDDALSKIQLSLYLYDKVQFYLLF